MRSHYEMFKSKQPQFGGRKRGMIYYNIRLPAHMITPPALSIRFLSSLLLGLWSSDSAIAAEYKHISFIRVFMERKQQRLVTSHKNPFTIN